MPVAALRGEKWSQDEAWQMYKPPVPVSSSHRHISLCAANPDLPLYFGPFRRIELVPYSDHTTALNDCNGVGTFPRPK